MKQLLSDPKTSIVGGACMLSFLVLTGALITKNIDSSSYAAALAAIATFGTGLIGIFSKDSKPQA